MGRKRNQNYISITGKGEGTLYYASEAMGGLEPDGVTLAMRATEGCILLGPKGTDTVRCVVLTSDSSGVWKLIDYRTVVPDRELDKQVKALRDKINPLARDYVTVEGTQELEYRVRAVKFRKQSLGE